MKVANRVHHFTESVIREMTRLAARYGAINLGQGMPDFPAPEIIQEAACRAIRDGYNQYAITWGAPALRQAIAKKVESFNRISCDPETNITVCCGATECMISTMLALVNPGDEVIIFQPFYENYGPDAIISGAKPVFIPLQPPHWNFDPDQLIAAFNDNTKALILNTPNNPTGKVFTHDELSLIAQLCTEHDVYVFSDEIYEHIIYSNTPHISIASLPGMSERTVTISGLSKTFSVTGWRLGYCVATAEITNAIRKTHDFLTVGAPHPLQMAAAAALSLPESYYQQLQRDYLHRKNTFLPYLKNSGLTVYEPEGAYYVMTDISPLGWNDDTAFVKKMIEKIGVSAVPGSSFYSPKEIGKTMVRFMFAKRDETLHAAGERLARLKSLRPD